MNNEHVEHNGSGYLDPTVDAVVKQERNKFGLDKEDCKFKSMTIHMKTIL